MRKSQLLLIATLVTCAAPSYGRSCNGNTDLVGTFGYVGMRSIFPAVPITPPGTTATIQTGVPFATLITGAQSALPFNAIGTVYFDGAGGVFAAPDAVSTRAPAGTYSVGMDCSVTMTFNNIFAPTTTNPNVTVATGANSISLQGFLSDLGNEVDLQAAVPSGATALGATITLRRTIQPLGCSNATLNGTLSINGMGSAVPSGTPAGTFTNASAFALQGRIVADGNGNLVTDSLSNISNVKTGLITGTYTVNSDCTGTAMLNTQANPATGATAQTRAINFVIVTEPGSSRLPPDFAMPMVLFSVSGTNVWGNGTAYLQ